MKRILDSIKTLDERGDTVDVWLICFGVAAVVAGAVAGAVALVESGVLGTSLLGVLLLAAGGVRALARRRGDVPSQALRRAAVRRAQLIDEREPVPDLAGRDLG